MSDENLDCVAGAPIVRAIDAEASLAMYQVYVVVAQEHGGMNFEPECHICHAVNDAARYASAFQVIQ